MQTRTILLLGLAVREAFSFWTGHPFDFEVWVRTGYWITKGMTPYNSIPPAPGVTFANPFGGPGLEPAIGYLPFWPIVLGAIYELYSLGGAGNRFVYYFMVKQPIILGDVLLAFALFLYLKRRSSSRAQQIMAIWLFSPFTIILSGIWGNFDGLAMLFVMLALLAPRKRTRSVWHGIGIFVKSIPVIYILPLCYPRDSKAVNLFIALSIPVSLTLLVTLLEGWPWSTPPGASGGVYSTLSSTLWKTSFPLSLWGTLVYLNILNVISFPTLVSIVVWAGYLWIPAVVAASLLSRRWFGFETDRGIIQSLLVVTLTFLLVRGQVNEQYAVYLLALLLIDVALWSPKRMRLFVAVSIVILAATVTNNFLLVRFIAPIYPDAVQFEANLLGPWGPLRNVALYIEGLIFCGLNIWYLAALIKERRLGASVGKMEGGGWKEG